MTATALSPTTIKMDADTKERVKRLADARHRSSHWMILEAIRQYVDREEKRELLRQMVADSLPPGASHRYSYQSFVSSRVMAPDTFDL